jgi:hypothetical protein
MHDLNNSLYHLSILLISAVEVSKRGGPRKVISPLPHLAGASVLGIRLVPPGCRFTGD